MKRKMLVFFCVFVSVICCVFGLTACGNTDESSNNSGNDNNTEQGDDKKPDDGNGEDKDVKVESVLLNNNVLSLEVGDTYTLTSTVLPADATDKSVTWSSSDTDIVTVANGKLTAVDVGEATVTVTTKDGNKTAECVVQVNEPVIKVESVSLSETSIKLGVGEEATLVATILPADATDKNVIWSSSDESIVTVDEGIVTAVDIGKATITVSTISGNKTAECDIAVEGLEFSEIVENGKVVAYSVTGIGNVTDKEIVIPAEHNGKKVTVIGEGAFKDCDFMTGIVIPNTILSVGGGAFAGCKNLEKAVLPNLAIRYMPLTRLKTIEITDGEKIDDREFYNCNNLLSIKINEGITSIGDFAFSMCGNLTDISLPDSLIYVGDSAFYGCPLKYNVYEKAKYLGNSNNNYVVLISAENSMAMTSCSINKSTKIIYDLAFKGCSSLISVSIPNGVVAIGDGTFSDCSKLTEISIPNSIINIGDSAFYGCNALQYNEYNNAMYLGNSSNNYVVLVKAKNKSITSCTINSATKIIYEAAFQGCKSLQAVTFPAGLISIKDKAFNNCNLKSVSISDKVNYIGASAFCNCSSLNSVTIGKGVTSIGDNAFSGCSNLKSITIPGNVQSIGNRAFYQCGLTSVYIECGVISIGDEAFAHCALKSINVPDSIKNYGADIFIYNSIYLQYNVYDDVAYLGNDENPYTILYRPVKWKSTYKINEKTKIISDGAFAANTTITSMNIPDSVEIIGDEAFKQSEALKSVIIGNGVTYIGENAFDSCGALTSVTIGNNVMEVGGGAFGDCNNLKEVHINDLANWSEISFGYSGYTDYSANPLYYAHNLYLNGKLVTELSIPDEVINIGDAAFYHISAISITIPDSVLSIGSAAFCGCTELKNVTIPYSVAYIGNNAFAGCKNLKSLIISEGVTSIGYGAFNNCSSLISITFPKSIVSIGRNVVQGCSSLENISVTAGNQNYHSQDNCLIKTSDKNLISGCKNSVIPSDGSVTFIADDAFYGCVGLTNITIPKDVTTIGSYAFYGCSNLISINIPEGVISMDAAIFCDCSNLRSVTIAQSVKYFNRDIFRNCGRLSDITFKGKKTEWNAISKHDSSWNMNTGNYIIHCSDGDISK